MIISPLPGLTVLSMLLSIPPAIMTGSLLPSLKIYPTIKVVVVLPCVPPTAMLIGFNLIISPSISARRIMGIFFFEAAIISGLSDLIADE